MGIYVSVEVKYHGVKSQVRCSSHANKLWIFLVRGGGGGLLPLFKIIGE